MRLDSGTLATDGTEQILGTNRTDDRFYQLLVTRSAMLAGDVLTVRVYTRMLVIGDAYEVLFAQTFNDAPSVDDVQQVSIPFPSDVDMKCTITCTTGRSIKWKLFAYGSA